MTHSPRILMVVTSHGRMGQGQIGEGEDAHPTGLWFEELSTPYFVFRDAGAAVTLASIRGGKPPIDPSSLKARGENPDSVERFLADEGAMAALEKTSPLEGLEAADWDAVFLPGGHGTMWDLPESTTLADLLGQAWAEGRVVAAVCHGPAGLVTARDEAGESLVKGRRVTGFSNGEEAAVGLTGQVPFLLEDRLRALGGRYESAPDFQPHALADGRLVTGQNPASSGETARLTLAALGLGLGRDDRPVLDGRAGR
ncbi:type 1 glutamine amidotransferase domain-containing protein [Rhodospirillum sp. A1_3_36]|uniref:type 1 glutamine amidotransferase domain-containing protein n=1 Tax=Rhodospirillum sp. A1_3_36 TaxID=3391666 RepID=UPI0039A77D78